MSTKNSKSGIKLSGVSRFDGGVNGWARGRNGWRFEFCITKGLIEIDTREQTSYDAKADERQIRRALKIAFADVFNKA